MRWRRKIEGLKPFTSDQTTLPWEAPPGLGAHLVEECEKWLKSHLARSGEEAVGGASTLPSDYRSYLQEIPLTAHFYMDVVFAVEPMPALDDGRDALSSLCGCDINRGTEIIAKNENYNASYKGTHASDIFDDHFIIGESWGNFPIVLKLTEPRRGSIALWDRYSPMKDEVGQEIPRLPDESGSDKGNIYRVADSFSAFIGSLRKEGDLGA